MDYSENRYLDEEQLVEVLRSKGYKIKYFAPDKLQLPGKHYDSSPKRSNKDDMFESSIFEKYSDEMEDIKRGRFSLEDYGYTPEQIMLVHTTNIFALDNFLKPIQDGEVLTKTDGLGNGFTLSNRCRQAVLDKWRAEGREPKSQGPYSEFGKECKAMRSQLEVYQRQYRSTKHFTQNCLVSNHGGGNWTGMPFIYIEPLVREGKFTHLDETCLSLAPHDSFFKGGLQMHEPTLMISAQALNELLNYPDRVLRKKIMDTLKNTQIVLIDPSVDAHIYVDNYLARIGCPFYECDEHGVKHIDDSRGKHGVFEALTDYAEQHKIPQGGDHFDSVSKQYDMYCFAKCIYEDTRNYLLYIATNCRGGDSKKLEQLKEKILDLDDEVAQYEDPNDKDEAGKLFPYEEHAAYYEDQIEKLKTFASNIGLFETIDFEVLKGINKAYNKECLEVFHHDTVRIENIDSTHNTTVGSTV